MAQLPFRSATELAAAIRAREISSTELLDCYLGRIEEFNPGLGAVVTLDADRARREAAAADRRLARGGEAGPLHGLPVTVKDCLETAGLRTTWFRDPWGVVFILMEKRHPARPYWQQYQP